MSDSALNAFRDALAAYRAAASGEAIEAWVTPQFAYDFTRDILNEGARFTREVTATAEYPRPLETARCGERWLGVFDGVHLYEVTPCDGAQVPRFQFVPGVQAKAGAK